MASQLSKAVVEQVGRLPGINYIFYIFYIFPGNPHRCPLAIQATDHSEHIWKSGDMTGRMVESEIAVEISILIYVCRNSASAVRLQTQVIYLTTHETSLRNMWQFCMPQEATEDVPHSVQRTGEKKPKQKLTFWHAACIPGGGTSRFATDKLQMVAQPRSWAAYRFAGARKQSVKCLLNTNVIYREKPRRGVQTTPKK